LIDGFKDMKRAKFDNRIMERVFDEKYVERQVEESHKEKQRMLYQARPLKPQQQMVYPGQIITTDNTGGRILGAIGLGYFQMNIITVDFETAYGGTLGFRTQTTEEYIRDPRFEVIGVAVQVNDGEPVWFSGTHQKMYEFLNKYDWKNSLALAHNAIFHGPILNWQYGITPKGWLDTLSMGRALHGTNVGEVLRC
jgi:hypothetical protein